VTQAEEPTVGSAAVATAVGPGSLHGLVALCIHMTARKTGKEEVKDGEQDVTKHKEGLSQAQMHGWCLQSLQLGDLATWDALHSATCRSDAQLLQWLQQEASQSPSGVNITGTTVCRPKSSQRPKQAQNVL
jgi:hypothetical protein